MTSDVYGCVYWGVGWLVSNCLGSRIFMRFLSHPSQRDSLSTIPKPSSLWPTLASPSQSHMEITGLWGQLQLAGLQESPSSRSCWYYAKCDEKGHRWLVIPLKNKGKKINHRIPFLSIYLRPHHCQDLRRKLILGLGCAMASAGGANQ